MADPPTLYVRIGRIADGLPPNEREIAWDTRPASPSEILSAARPHLDYEAAEEVFLQWLGYQAGRGNIETRAGFKHADVRAIVDAALGLTEEGH